LRAIARGISPAATAHDEAHSMTTPKKRRESGPRPLQRWDPWRELADLHERLDRLVERGGAAAPRLDAARGHHRGRRRLDVEAELPGIDRNDINIELRDNELSITGEIKERERKGILRRRTRRVGEFDFRVTLPGHVEADGVEASCGTAC
jgi:HSP20 family protein